MKRTDLGKITLDEFFKRAPAPQSGKRWGILVSGPGLKLNMLISGMDKRGWRVQTRCRENGSIMIWFETKADFLERCLNVS